MIKAICFDMDGTLVSLYDVPNWLEMLIAEDTTPYTIAKPLLRLAPLARVLNRLQKKGYNLTIISWLSKNGTETYNEAVTQAKLKWLAKHLPSVTWDEINIVPYGTPKQNFCKTSLDILFDDEKQNRDNWLGTSYDEKNILKTLNKLLTN